MQTLPTIDQLQPAKLLIEKEGGNRYTWEKKYAVAAVYLQCKNIRETAERTGINPVTLEGWRKATWWPDMIKEIQDEGEAKLDSKLGQIIAKALETVDDRLINGELILNNKTGELVRKPVNLRDATRAAVELRNAQEKLHKNSKIEQVKHETVKETLAMLAAEFAKFASKEAKTIDMEEANALYEERQEGLQAGSS